MASVAVPRNVTGISAGTTMHCGTNEYCCAISRTMTLPSGSSDVPRLLSTNSPFRCDSVLTSMVSTRDGGIDGPVQAGHDHHQHQHGDDGGDDVGPPALGRDRDGFRMPASRASSRSLDGPSRQVDEEVEQRGRWPRRWPWPRRRRRTFRRPVADDVDRPRRSSVSLLSRPRVSVIVRHSGSSLRRSLACAAVTGVPLFPQATRM